MASFSPFFGSPSVPLLEDF